MMLGLTIGSVAPAGWNATRPLDVDFTRSAFADTISTRAGTHPEYGRMVFDWDRDVDFTASVQDGRLIIRFSEAITTNLADTILRLRDYVSDGRVEGDGRTVSFTLKGPFDIRSFTANQTKVVVDILGPGLSASPTSGPTAAVVRPTANPTRAAPGQVQIAQTSGPLVPVRTGDHGEYSRLVFDWTQRVEYQIDRTGDQATITFVLPARIDASAAERQMPRNISAIRSRASGSGIQISLTIPATSQIRHFRTGDKVVIDVLDPQPGAAPIQSTTRPTAAQQPVAAQSNVPAGSQPTAQSTAPRLPTGTPVVPSSQPRAGGGSQLAQNPTIAPAQPIQPSLQEPSAAPSIAPSIVPSVSPGPARQPQPAQPFPSQTIPVEPAPVQQAPVQAQPRPVPTGTPPAAIVQQAPPAPPPSLPPSASVPEAAPSPTLLTPSDRVEAPAGDITPTTPIAAPIAPSALSGLDLGSLPPPATGLAPAAGSPIQVQFVRGEDGGSLGFYWPYIVPIAAFKVDNALFVVFDEAGTLDFSSVQARGGDFLVNPTQLEDIIGGADAKGTVARFDIRAGYEPTVERDGATWIVRLARTKQPLSDPLLPEPRRVGSRQTIQVPSTSLGGTVLFRDPITFLKLYATPSQVVGQGMQETMEFPRFRLLETAQGIVTSPNDDTIYARSFDDGVEITSPSGVSAPDTVTGATQTDADPNEEDQLPELFPLARWRGGDDDKFVTRLSQLQRVLAQQFGTPLENDARLALAQFYFAHGLAYESRSFIDRILEQDPAFLEDRVFQAMRGVTHLMLRDADAAEPDLSIPSLDGEPEAELWRGYLAYLKDDFATAAQKIVENASLIERYSKHVRGRIGLVGAEAAIYSGDNDTAVTLLDQLQSDSLLQSDYSRAVLLRAIAVEVFDDAERARGLYESVANDEDQLARTRAQFRLIDAQLKAGEIDINDAIIRFDRLRYAWRGDIFEFEVLKRLGDLYEQKKDFRNTLLMYRRAVTYYPNIEPAQALRQRMSDIFADLYLRDEADNLPPLTALALFDEFRELTPVGPEGDEMIRKLADRLENVDLLDRAAILLEHQVKFRLAGEDRAAVGAELARLRLLDRKPQLAQEALELSMSEGGISQALQQRRDHLLARAMFDMGDADTAIGLLLEDESQEGTRLLARFYWVLKDWEGAAQKLADIAPIAPQGEGEFTESEARDVMALGVALSLAEDYPSIDRLRLQYGPAMAKSRYADDFKLITSAASNPNEIRTVAEELGEITYFEDFLKSYRQRQREEEKARTSALN